jgi:aldose 1-epimerase
MMREEFGRTVEGEIVERATIRGGGLTASVITFGAALQDLRLEGHQPPLVLGFREFAHYRDHSPYFGATAGRCANRIAGARFALDGREYRTDANFLERHTLHGGSKGVGKRNWRIGALEPHRVVLTLTDPDKAMGFPGTCRFEVEYELKEGGVLEVAMKGETTKATPVSLAHHSYFNLDGGEDILDHRLRIEAAAFLPVDAELIPTGEVRLVAGTPHDFRLSRPIRRSAGETVHDHNFCLAAARRPLSEAAEVASDRSGITMTVATTEPGLQFYAGHKLDTPVAGLTGRRYGAFAGLCLEPQMWPDAVHHPHFPSPILRPGEVYRQATQYRFARG